MDRVLHYLTYPYLLEGAWIALEVGFLSMVGGLALAFPLALARTSRYRVLKGLAGFYIWFVRGTPVLLQLAFMYDVLPSFHIILSAETTAVITFALNEAAFGSEIVRGGMASVNRTQRLAAASLGMGTLTTFRRIIVPLALRAIVPPLTNDTIAVLKGTSLASVIAVNELTLRSEQLVSVNFEFFQVFVAAGVMYLVITTGISWLGYLVERRFNLDIDRRPRSGVSQWVLGLRTRGSRSAAEAAVRSTLDDQTSSRGRM